VFVFDCPDADGVHHESVVCNPELYLPEGKDRHLDEGEEGCLSFPGAFLSCARPDYAEVRGQGLDGQPVHHTGTGMLSRCLQHETDHCQGRVFGDRLPRRASKQLRRQHDDAADEYPPGWPATADDAPAPADG